jgi:O-antigen/teichoic acid export membrane protein
VLRLFGDSYREAAPVMRVLSAVMLLAVACGMVSMVLEMAGRSVATLLQTLLALAANVGLNLLLIPHWGLVGAAVAWAAAIALNNLIPFAQLHRDYRMQPLGAGALVAMVAATVCFGLLPGAAAWLAPGRPAVLISATAAGAALYLLALWRARRVLQMDLLMAAVRRRSTRSVDIRDQS